MLKSKEKPRKLFMRGSDGQRYIFLCKKENRGDMRKNSRMMEFNSVVNRLLKKDPEARKRRLRLRTYAVIPMNEECGILEWVENTVGFRNLVKELHDRLGLPASFAYIRNQYEAMGERPTAQAELFLHRRLVYEFKPVFHKWYLERFPEPTRWFESRLCYTRSVAVWSMVGYLVGLGDRHGENILLDTKNGECVHVDFDCLFGKGLTLEKPEIVPFRLTQNIVDAFGISGVEGVYRRSCEISMAVLRDNSDTLINVLQTFLHDPLVEWTRKSQTDDKNNKDELQKPKQILEDIEQRLKGLVDPGKDRLAPALSVHGQVHQLIRAAMSEDNLSKMYVGWMPWI